MKDGTLKATEPICQTTMNAISDIIEECDESQRATHAVAGLAVLECACDGLDDGLVNVVDMSIRGSGDFLQHADRFENAGDSPSVRAKFR